MKRCGKSAPRSEQSDWQGKPHAKQDQIGEEEWPAPFTLPGRSLEPVSNGRPRGMVVARFGGNRNRLIDRAGECILESFPDVYDNVERRQSREPAEIMISGQKWNPGIQTALSNECIAQPCLAMSRQDLSP